MDKRFVPSPDSPSVNTGPAWWFLFKNHKMMIFEKDERVSVPFVADQDEIGLKDFEGQYMGTLDGAHCFCAELPENARIPEGASFRGLRALYEGLDEVVHKIAMRALHLVEWEKKEKYCSRCGKEMAHKEGTIARACSQCGYMVFPRISPAVIVLVEREGKVLLARASRFAENLYSVLAGFVEPGETLEETVQREIEEEVGIRVKNIRYFGSQPWPFPDSLMIGFTAEYESGEIKIDGDEISDARWFDWDNLPEIPGKISIARKLIDWFVNVRRQSACPRY